MRKYVFGSAALFALAWCGAFAAPMLETVENNHFRMTVDPLGARITSLVSKDAGVDFLGGDPVGEALKLFDDTVAQLEKALL